MKASSPVSLARRARAPNDAVAAAQMMATAMAAMAHPMAIVRRALSDFFIVFSLVFGGLPRQ